MSAARRQRKRAGQQSSSDERRSQVTRRGDSSSRSVLYLPLVLTLGLGLLSFVPRVQENLRLTWSFWGAVAALLLWWVILSQRLSRASEGRSITNVFRPQHYVQALAQFAVFAYWGYYWSPVYDFAGLILAQLAFAYAFDMLLAWSRRENYVLGFGPFPIIFSINLFIWFKDDWFYLQFLMVGVGFLGKELVRWYREGRRVHIFNPSAFALGLFSLVLISTGTTDLTWAPEIASTLTLAPQIYTYLFAVGLVVMYFFSITLVSGAAAAVLFGGSALYYAWTGVPYFIDSEIPAAVFLGLHLLITDPSTSPRTPTGKFLFGILYGVGVFGLYLILGLAGAPTFYDKLLCVPLLNLSVRGIDAFVQHLKEAPFWTRLRLEWALGRPNLAYMVVWIAFFGVMSVTGKTDARHTGDSLPFWEQACQDGRRNACSRLLQIEATYCGDNSAWACNELGGHYTEGKVTSADPSLAAAYFSRACELRFQPACFNLLDPTLVERANPRVLDLRLLLREAGQNLMETPEPELYDRACEHGWGFACDQVALTL